MVNRIISTISFFLLSIFLLEACSSVSRYSSRREDVPNRGRDTEEITRYSDNSVLETETGIASYYADKFNGRKTFSGEVFDMYGNTAAHPSYPMNTVVRVTNLENNKEVILRINDRMPQRSDRIIDLSLGAAQSLDFVKDGLAKVKIEVLEWGQ